MISDHKVTEAEQAKYWEIFTSLTQTGLLNGQQAKSVLLNSQLPSEKLEKIWDLADIDGDGCLDFEEFCIAMRLIFDTINGVESSFDDFLIPASKSHLVAASKAISGNEPELEHNLSVGTDEPEQLSDSFDWYMSPGNKERYDAVYTSAKDRHGHITFDSLTDLYASLNVPDRDLRRAWNLVNPRSDHTIGKDQTLVFLHILNQRQKGIRIPQSVPASLRATFEKTEPAYKVQNLNENSSSVSNKKSEFAEGYLSRMGLGGRSSGYESKGTDFTQVKDTDWEEVRLRRELEDLERKCEEAEMEAKRRKQTLKTSSKISLVRRELDQLLEYKKKQLQTAKHCVEKTNQENVARIKSDIDMLSQNVEILQQHLAKREKDLEEIKNEISRKK